MATRAVARETVFALRREIARIEGSLPERLDAPACAEADDEAPVLRRAGVPARPAVLATGAATLDDALGGGVPQAALTEIHGRQARDAGAAAGFVLGLAVLAMKRTPRRAPLLWLATGEAFREAGTPYAPGLLHRFGLAPDAVLMAGVARIEDALWVAEEAAALTGFAAVLLEVRGQARKLDLTATRRLHRRAQAAGRPFFLLRQTGEPEPTAAPVRLLVSPAPAGERRILSGPLAGSIGPPACRVEIGRSRTALPAAAVLEWDRDERAFHERPLRAVGAQDAGPVVSLHGDRPHPAGAAGTRLAFRDSA